MNEIIFIFDEAAEGGYTARALGEDIITEADDLENLHAMIRDAVPLHYHHSNINFSYAGFHCRQDQCCTA